MQDLTHRYHVSATAEVEAPCLITHSLTAETHLETDVIIAT